MVKIQFDGNRQYKLTLPKQIVEAKGWGKGDEVRVLLSDSGDLVLRREQRGKGKEGNEAQ